MKLTKDTTTETTPKRDSLTPHEISIIRSSVKRLNKVLVSVTERYPDAQWYLDGTSNLNLMSAAPHDEFHMARQERILMSVVLEMSSGGDW